MTIPKVYGPTICSTCCASWMYCFQTSEKRALMAHTDDRESSRGHFE